MPNSCETHRNVLTWWLYRYENNKINGHSTVNFDRLGDKFYVWFIFNFRIWSDLKSKIPIRSLRVGGIGISSIISKISYFRGYWPRVTLNDLGGKFVETLRSRALIWAKTCLFLATVENWPHMTLNGPMWPESNFVVEIDLKSWWLSWAIVWKTEWACDLSKISSLVKRLIFLTLSVIFYPLIWFISHFLLISNIITRYDSIKIEIRSHKLLLIYLISDVRVISIVYHQKRRKNQFLYDNIPQC